MASTPPLTPKERRLGKAAVFGAAALYVATVGAAAYLLAKSIPDTLAIFVAVTAYVGAEVLLGRLLQGTGWAQRHDPIALVVAVALTLALGALAGVLFALLADSPHTIRAGAGEGAGLAGGMALVNLLWTRPWRSGRAAA
jgi:hypothetical protein